MRRAPQAAGLGGDVLAWHRPSMRGGNLGGTSLTCTNTVPRPTPRDRSCKTENGFGGSNGSLTRYTVRHCSGMLAGDLDT